MVMGQLAGGSCGRNSDVGVSIGVGFSGTLVGAGFSSALTCLNGAAALGVHPVISAARIRIESGKYNLCIVSPITIIPYTPQVLQRFPPENKNEGIIV
jgi:hypothetical protein